MLQRMSFRLPCLIFSLGCFLKLTSGALLSHATHTYPIFELITSFVLRAGADPRHMAEFGASIFLSGPWDWEFNGNTSRCTDMVDRIDKYNIHFVQSVPTFYWWDLGPLDPPPGFNNCTSYNLSDYYCFGRFNATKVDHWCYNRYVD
jgi:hypothetical protein